MDGRVRQTKPPLVALLESVKKVLVVDWQEMGRFDRVGRKLVRIHLVYCGHGNPQEALPNK